MRDRKALLSISSLVNTTVKEKIRLLNFKVQMVFCVEPKARKTKKNNLKLRTFFLLISQF